MKPLTIESRKNKNLHTIPEYARDYMQKNIEYENVEKHISKYTNKQTGISKYRACITINGKIYEKYYPSVEQARIFRNTILKHFRTELSNV